MQAFILVSLTEVPAFTYQQPILQWVKTASKNSMVVLDIDAFSEEALVNHACQLMQEAEVYTVYFKLQKNDATLGASLKIVEEIIRSGKAGLVLLEGKHQRLSAIFSSRPEINFKAAATESDLRTFISSFINEAT